MRERLEEIISSIYEKLLIPQIKEALIKLYSAPIYVSGMVIPPQKFAAQLFFITLISMIIAIAFSLLVSPIGAIFLIIPMLYGLLPRIELMKRKNDCERELPFVSTFLTMAATSSISLSSAILSLSKARFLKAFAREAMRMEKVRKLYALSSSDAIIFEAKNHPSEYVKSTLLTAISAQRSGESPYLVMKDEMIKSFTILLSRLKALSDKFSLLASTQIIVFIIIPMAMMTMGAIFSGFAKPTFLMFACIGLPCLFTPMISYFVDLCFPKELTNPLNLLPFAISLSFIPISVLILLHDEGFFTPFPYVLSILIMAFTAPAAIVYSSQRRKTKQILEALPSFTRSMAEEVKKGLSPAQALSLLSKNRTFNPFFDEILSKIAIYVRGGLRIVDASSIIKMPWMAHVYFELLDYAEQIGADPRAMEALSDLVNNIHSSMKSLSSQTSLFKYSCVINSVILPFVIAMVIEVVAKLLTDVSSLLMNVVSYLPFGISFATPEQLSTIRTIAYSGVVLNAYLLGLIGGKVSGNGSIVDGLSMALICTAIASISLFAFVELNLLTSMFNIIK